jgi:DNA-directed RNA polymerase subunit RPC12/RpoP
MRLDSATAGGKVRTYFKCLKCGRKVDGFVPADPRRLVCTGCGARNPVIGQEPIPLPALRPVPRAEMGKGFAPEFSR